MKYKRPTEACAIRYFQEICTICTSFHDALAVTVSLHLLKGLWSSGDIKLMGSAYPHIHSAP